MINVERIDILFVLPMIVTLYVQTLRETHILNTVCVVFVFSMSAHIES